MNIDVLNIQSPDWMLDPNRNCAGTPDANTRPARRAFGVEIDMKWNPDGLASEVLAVANCSGCPVRVACRNYALADPELVGVWGMTTTAEREAMRKDAVA